VVGSLVLPQRVLEKLTFPYLTLLDKFLLLVAGGLAIWSWFAAGFVRVVLIGLMVLAVCFVAFYIWFHNRTVWRRFYYNLMLRYAAVAAPRAMAMAETSGEPYDPDFGFGLLLSWFGLNTSEVEMFFKGREEWRNRFIKLEDCASLFPPEFSTGSEERRRAMLEGAMSILHSQAVHPRVATTVGYLIEQQFGLPMSRQYWQELVLGGIG
jgi:hypothetical protein